MKQPDDDFSPEEETYWQGFQDGHEAGKAIVMHKYEGTVLHIEKHPESGDTHLLPCPFCGTSEIIYWQYETVVGPRWRIFCLGCSATMDPGWAQNKVYLIERWNRREKP